MSQTAKRFDVYAIEETKDQKKYWHQVGVGFENKDGSINLRFYMLPGTQLQLRAAQDKKGG